MSTDNTLADVIGKQTNKGFLAWMVSRQVFWILLATVLACLALTVFTTSFDTPRNIFNVSRNFAMVGIIALGMTAVIISGGIDLSVGSTVLISAMVTTMLMHTGAPLWILMPAITRTQRIFARTFTRSTGLKLPRTTFSWPHPRALGTHLRGARISRITTRREPRHGQ